MSLFQSITHLKPGEKAPDFKLQDQNENICELKNYRGKKVALYFYPNDDTETCIKEACNLRDHYTILLNNGFTVIGISHAPVESKKKFTVKYNLPFILLSDPGFVICKLYGVFGDKLFMGKIIQTIHRITFIIDENGLIERVIHRVKSGFAAQQIVGDVE